MNRAATAPVSAETESASEGLADFVFSDFEVAEIPMATECSAPGSPDTLVNNAIMS
jgi:hypothetical protein